MNSNQCNQYQSCNKCQKEIWLGDACQMENWKEHGVFCEGCLDQTEKHCYYCSKHFVDREWTEKELKEERSFREDLKKHGYHEEPKLQNLRLTFCRGGAPCHIKVNPDCRGHRIRQYGIFCSSECSNDYYKIINKTSRKFKEWKKVAEKRGFQRCQEENVFHKHPETAKWLLEDLKFNKKKLACWGYARAGEKYCEDCKQERGEGQKRKERSWQEDYRKYWNLTDENTYQKDNSENNLAMSSDENDLQSQIKEKEQKLEKLIKEDNSSPKIQELKTEIQNLKSRQKNSSASENLNKDKSSVITYSIIGLSALSLIGFIIILVKSSKKNSKIK